MTSPTPRESPVAPDPSAASVARLNIAFLFYGTTLIESQPKNDKVTPPTS